MLNARHPALSAGQCIQKAQRAARFAAIRLPHNRTSNGAVPEPINAGQAEN